MASGSSAPSIGHGGSVQRGQGQPLPEAAPIDKQSSSLPLWPNIGPHLQVPATFADQNREHIVLALQSGLKSEVAWALNALTVLSYRDKDDAKKETVPIAKLPGVLDALLHVVDEWRDVARARDSAKLRRVRVLGGNRAFTGFGPHRSTVEQHDPLWHLQHHPDSVIDSFESGPQSPWQASQHKARSIGGRAGDFWDGEWWDDDGLFNLDPAGREEQEQWAVAASNVLRNMSFMPESERVMAASRRCLECLVVWLEDHRSEDEELVSNTLDIFSNLAPAIDIRVLTADQAGVPSKFSVRRVMAALQQLLEAPTKSLIVAAADTLARLALQPENEPLITPFCQQLYPRLVAMLVLPDNDVQASAVNVLYNYVEIDIQSRGKLGREPGVVPRLLSIMSQGHPLVETVRKAALTLETLAFERENHEILLVFEASMADITMSDNNVADVMARILYHLSTNVGVQSHQQVQGAWGLLA